MSTKNNVITVSDDEFTAQVLQSDTPVLVDFWAPWCGPCKAIAPILVDIAETYGERLIIAKVNIDDNPKRSADYGVRSIPTLILFKNGEKLEQKVGTLSKGQITAFLDEHLGTGQAKTHS